MASINRFAELQQQAKAAAGRADHASNGWLGTLYDGVDSFAAARGAQASAAVSYYTMFSLFPILLVLVISLSYVVDTATAQNLVLTLLRQMLPDESVTNFVTETFANVLSLRGQVGLISLIALLWSASGAFTTLTFNIELAWLKHRRRPNPLKARLIGLLLIVLLFLAMLLALILSTAAGVLQGATAFLTQLGFPDEGARLGVFKVVSLVVTALVYTGLYRWIPSSYVSWRAALVPALLAAVTSQVINAGYSWYLGSSLSRYEFLYGPLTTIIILMFWFYLTVLVILVGAHFSAAVSRRFENRNGDAATPLPQ